MTAELGYIHHERGGAFERKATFVEDDRVVVADLPVNVAILERCGINVYDTKRIGAELEALARRNCGVHHESFERFKNMRRRFKIIRPLDSGPIVGDRLVRVGGTEPNFWGDTIGIAIDANSDVASSRQKRRRRRDVMDIGSIIGSDLEVHFINIEGIGIGALIGDES